ncbi:rCG32961 [Rattus norvegicus]|uniref:RCG22663 n=1 Tax=Rattus norvegicus TaxID=10116 RepID=A6JNG7_RAT|nr:rCG22663 [Rattus norvegicus]EDL78399.1 rCG31857 [Rattus norvegicus]EDL91727.1 rCG24082 [Rattus norvegicus]EDM06556.1 rCG32961 [Rattus norvegicus]
MKIPYGSQDDLLGASQQVIKKGLGLLHLLTLLPWMPATVQGELRWGIMSTFPLPMPVMYH